MKSCSSVGRGEEFDYARDYLLLVLCILQQPAQLEEGSKDSRSRTSKFKCINQLREDLPFGKPLRERVQRLVELIEEIISLGRLHDLRESERSL